jgi:NAD-dependent deacetylase
MANDFETFIDEFSRAHSVSVLTGAGMSAESGVPTFRGKGGIWEEVSIEDVATLTAFRRDPVRVWEWFQDLRMTLDQCGPNSAHRALAVLEDRFEDFTLITQNIDNYHHLAGSRNVVEMHGNTGWDRCWSCGERYEVTGVKRAREELPPKCSCGGTLKPDVVFFEESLDAGDVERAFGAAQRSEFMLVIGTSAIVAPAASLPYIASQSGAKVIEINLEPTGHTSIASLSMFEPATIAMDRILVALEKRNE